MSVESDGGSILLTVDGETHRLSREAAAEIKTKVEDALTSRRTFFRTACEHREDGSYVVERRGADSTGNSTVFERYEEVRRLFDRLPEEFDAQDLDRAGITGSRRHMLVRHFAEHPEFPCELTSRNPLTAHKTASDG
ncbi:MAG: hypothetical protein ABEJ76_04550 [Halanaeroarchaeum sp.]